jgi:hypothetical protein
MFSLYNLDRLRKIHARPDSLLIKNMGDDSCANRLACLLQPTALLFARQVYC